jgi:hypothetical protein
MTLLAAPSSPERDRRVQLGDLLDRRASGSANLATARLAVGLLDVVLAGNHECRLLRERCGADGAALAVLAARGWPHAAAACGEWLVTHAGVHPKLARCLPPQAAECAAPINDRWHRRAPREDGDPQFDWIGPARGGRDPYGGIFWTHPEEWAGRRKTPWGQIVGHVPHRQPRLLQGDFWAIDLGARDGRLAALVRRGGQRHWRPVVVRAARERVRLRVRRRRPERSRLCRPWARVVPRAGSADRSAGVGGSGGARVRRSGGSVGEVMVESAKIEREVKLSVWPGYALPDLSEVIDGTGVDGSEEQRLDAVYHGR